MVSDRRSNERVIAARPGLWSILGLTHRACTPPLSLLSACRLPEMSNMNSNQLDMQRRVSF